jgi:hypothetical protein
MSESMLKRFRGRAAVCVFVDQPDTVAACSTACGLLARSPHDAATPRDIRHAAVALSPPVLCHKALPPGPQFVGGLVCWV